MAKKWKVQDPPSGLDPYEWRIPNNEEQHQQETVAPGDLLIKPKDMTLKPTKSPQRSGFQSGQDHWDFTSVPDTDWYIFGSDFEG